MTININVFGTLFIEHIIVSNRNSIYVILVYRTQLQKREERTYHVRGNANKGA